MSNHLADSWAKLNWAKRHFDCLKGKIKAWSTSKGEHAPFSTRLDEDFANNALVVRVDKVDPMPAEWALLVGDFLFNVRASLEYLAWKLVSLGTTPNPKDRRGVAFPIVLKPADWQSRVKGQLQGVTDQKIIDVIDKFQSYHLLKSGEDPETHALAFLKNLSDDDKHRQITLVYSRPTRYSLNIIRSEGFAVERTELPPPDSLVLVEPDAELGRIIGRPTAPKYAIEVEYVGSAIIAFNARTGVEFALDKIGKVTASILTEIEPLL